MEQANLGLLWIPISSHTHHVVGCLYLNRAVPPVQLVTSSSFQCRHMLFCSSLAFVLVASGKVQTIGMDRSTYFKYVVVSIRFSF